MQTDHPKSFLWKAKVWTTPWVWRERWMSRRAFEGKEKHLLSAIDWIEGAAKTASEGGFPAYYDLVEGWSGGCPEATSGFLSTLYIVSERLGRPTLSELATRQARWLLSIEDQIEAKSQGSVLYLGQVTRGLLAAFKRTDELIFREALIRAAERLMRIGWEVNACDTLAAFSLYRAGRELDRPEMSQMALQHYRWTLNQQYSSGFFRRAHVSEVGLTTTNALGCVIEGVYRIANEIQDAQGMLACERLMTSFASEYPDRLIPGSVDENLKSDTSWSCQKGNLQLGWVALRLSRSLGLPKVAGWGKRLIELSAAQQQLDASIEGIKGGVFGSTPISGKFFPYTILSSSVRYLVDALLEM